MNEFGVQTFDRIQYLIEEIQQKLSYDVTYGVQDCEELLALSEKHNYLYGQAYAHIYLANHYQILNDITRYDYHCEIANSIAKRKDYFDVLILYYSIVGLRYINESDEINAIEMYLEGAKLAISINDKEACSKFYNNIAEIYFNVKEYDEAEKFYIKASECLAITSHNNTILYRKIVLSNLIRVACINGYLEKAQKYYTQFMEIQCKDDMMVPICLEVSARMAILKHNIREALKNLEQLFSLLKTTKLKNISSESMYLYLLEMLMSLKEYTRAHQCIEEMQLIDQCKHTHIKLAVLQYKIQLDCLKGEGDRRLYRDFYNETNKFENANKTAMGESLKSFISLYEAEKEQSKMLVTQSRLENESKYDALTSVFNRRYLSKLISKSIQDSSIKEIAYIMIDVDHFKEFNDYYGHMQGDHVLKEVACCLQDNIVENAYVARYGGDEFACLFINYHVEDVITYVQNVQKMLQSKKIEHVKNKNINYVSLSFGIHCCDAAHIKDEFYLIKKADNALYEAKKNGRNTYSVYE